jgi:hypothetical protein
MARAKIVEVLRVDLAQFSRTGMGKARTVCNVVFGSSRCLRGEYTRDVFLQHPALRRLLALRSSILNERTGLMFWQALYAVIGHESNDENVNDLRRRVRGSDHN